METYVEASDWVRPGGVLRHRRLPEGDLVAFGPDHIQLGKRESVPDVARVLGRMADGIMARVFAHSDVEQLSDFAGVPVINGLSDEEHPCQSLTDLFTVYEKLHRVEGVNLTYIGDGNNVAAALLLNAAAVSSTLARDRQ